ncbi:MAG: TolC family protein, partial [Myxococcota bacterium]
AHALANNLGLKIERLDAAIAEQGHVAETWKFEPVLGASATHTDERDASDDRAQTTTVEASVTVPNRLGGQLTLSLPYTYRDSEQIASSDGAGNPVAEGTSNTPGLTLSLTQPLLRNAGLSVSHASIDQAGLRARQADGRVKLATIRLLALAEQSYWRYYAAYENLRIQKSKYDLATEQLRFAQRLVDEGVRTKNEVTRAAAGVAREFEAVIQAETQRRRSERELKRIINVDGLSVASLTAIQPGTSPSPMGLSFDRRALIALALDRRMDMLDNELQLAIDQRAIDVARNLTLPNVNLDFTYSFSGARSAFDDAIGRVLERDSNSGSVGVFVEVPLALDQSARARLRQSVLTRRQTLARRAELEQAVREDILNAVDAVEQGWQRVLANRHALTLA